MSAGKEQSVKWIEEAAEKIVTGGRTLTDADSTAKAMIQHTKTIIETCYNARSGEVSPDYAAIREKLEAMRAYAWVNKDVSILAQEALAMLPKEGE